MDIHMSRLVKAHSRLLADVCEATGVPLGTPGMTEQTYQWLLVEAPLLDKLVMKYLEADADEIGETPSEKADRRIIAEDLCKQILAMTPDWLFPLVERVVDRERSTASVRYLHQILVFCYKVKHEPTSEQLKTAQSGFEETDDNTRVWRGHALHSMASTDRMWSLARSLVCRVIGNINWNDITPSHGPGAVNPSYRPSAKSNSFVIYDSIQEHYPYDQYFVSQPDGLLTKLGYMCSPVSTSKPIVAKMVAVPKDSRGPRLICVHPAEAIWIQQGQRRLLEAAIQHHPLTRGRINFRDQTVNGALALSSSEDRQFMTIDLKEASDRISTDLVKYLFGDFAYSKISCSRATHVELLDKRVRTLEKWAPMGNALCFPVESLVFWAIVHAGICARHRLTTCDDVYVFGDDILVPSKYYEGCLYGLARAGLVPNMDKTFRRGFFRESCGVDAYHGEDVTPLRMKEPECATVLGAVSWCDLAKRARLAGYHHLAGYLYSCVRFHRKLPLCNNPMAAGIYEYVGSFREVLLYENGLRYYRSHQVYRVPVTQVVATVESLHNHGWNHVLDSLCSLSLKDGEYSDNGLEYPVPYRERPTYGWAVI